MLASCPLALLVHCELQVLYQCFRQKQSNCTAGPFAHIFPGTNRKTHSSQESISARQAALKSPQIDSAIKVPASHSMSLSSVIIALVIPYLGSSTKEAYKTTDTSRTACC